MKPIDWTEETYNQDDEKQKKLLGIDGYEKSSGDTAKKVFPDNMMNKGKNIPLREQLEKKFQET